MNDIIEQGSDAWREIRIGRVTASRMGDLMARVKSGWGASRANYLAELVAERLTGEAAEGYTNAAMAWGLEKEPDAKSAYEFRTDTEITPAGFVIHPTIPQSGASPDGLIGDDGLIEIKCPLTAGHIDTLLGKSVPGKYVYQIQWQLATTGRKWCDFVSFDPRMPEQMRLFITRVKRDPVMIKDLEICVKQFLTELDEKVAELKRLYSVKEAAE